MEQTTALDEILFCTDYSEYQSVSSDRDETRGIYVLSLSLSLYMSLCVLAIHTLLNHLHTFGCMTCGMYNAASSRYLSKV